MAKNNQAIVHKRNGNTGDEQSLTYNEQEIDTPLLPVEQLERLANFRPDLIDWVIEQTTKEAEDRRNRQAKLDGFIFKERMTGQKLGFVIAAFAIVAGGFTAMYSPWAATVIVSVSVGTLAVAFLKKD